MECSGAKIPDMLTTQAERAAYAKGYEAACAALREVHCALGWQGGTIHQVVSEVRLLREQEQNLRAALIAAVKAAQGFRDGKVDEARRHLATAVAVGVRHLDARRLTLTPKVISELPTMILAVWSDGQDRSRCSPVPTSTSSTPSTSPVP